MSTPTTAITEASVAKPETTIPEEVDTKNGVTQSLPPSHILEDGRLIYLPPPNAAERSRFFERSIARHGLLQADMEKKEDSEKSQTKQDVKVLESKTEESRVYETLK